MQRLKEALASNAGTIITGDYAKRLSEYLGEPGASPLLMLGDALAVLRELPDSSVNCAMTSPP
jgi:site-specific DNA-methyltransferase (adenine-specific)